MPYDKADEIVQRHSNNLRDDIEAAFKAGFEAGRAREAEEANAVRDQLKAILDRLDGKSSRPVVAERVLNGDDSITATVKAAMNMIAWFPDGVTPEQVTNFCHEKLGKSYTVEQVRPALKSLTNKTIERVARGRYRPLSTSSGSTTDASSPSQSIN
jgi:hypothetical protein